MMRYTDEFRSNAVAMLQMQGYPDKPGALMAVARYLNVSHANLSRWFRLKQNPPPPKMVQVKKEQIVALIKQEIRAALQDLPSARPDADYRAIGTVIGILVDKMQLLEGEPTSRIEWRTQAIKDIQAGTIDYQALVEAFDDSFAAELFAAAGVPVPITESAGE